MVGAKRAAPSESLRRACLHWLSEYGRVDKATQRTVESGLQRAWDSGEPYMQYAALQFIMYRRSSKGQAVIARALRSRHPSMVGNALSAAHVLAHHDRKFRAPLVKALQRVVERGILESERWWALNILGRAGAAQPWIEELAESSPSAELRLEAARILLGRRSALGKKVLLDTLRADQRGLLVAHEVWAGRDVLDLSPAELRQVKRAVVRYMESHRRRLHAASSSNRSRRRAADVLRELASDGFPLTDRDKKAIRTAMRKALDDD